MARVDRGPVHRGEGWKWLLRMRASFEPPTVTTQRQSVYIEEEEDED